jgi:C4-dicarboxylate-specific signal transduction histidine kinase
MEKEIRILMLEDTPTDAELNLRELRRESIPHTARRVETEQDFRREMESWRPDLILADYSLPAFDGLTALAIAREKRPEIPFIFVTGTMGEEIAIETLKNGATDYVLKHRLGRLIPSVKRALREAEDLRRRLEAEQALREETMVRLRTMESLREKEQLLLHQSRQAAMGETIDYIAHQWKQPLNTLSLIVQFLGDTFHSGECSDEYMDETVDQILNIIMHMSRTIEDFRNFSKPDREMNEFNLKETVSKTLILVADSFKAHNITVDIDDEEDLIATGYQNEYSQVLLIILNNARDILMGREVASPQIAIKLFREGKKTVTTIRDNAGGIPDEIIGRIFDPYFTTKKEAEGCGIGLYISRFIIEKRMNGIISVRNTDEGAEFRIEVGIEKS